MTYTKLMDTNEPMTPLSPAAQAVRDAALATYDKSIPKDDSLWALDRASVVAALRAAATHLPMSAMYPSSDWGHAWRDGINDARQKLLAIAAELEGVK